MGKSNLSIGQLLWIVTHELGHVLQDGHPTASEAIGFPFCRNLEVQFDEALADDVAFDLMINYSIRWQDRQKVIRLLNTVDLVLSFMHLMQAAFPTYHDRKQKAILVSEGLDHHIAAVRRDRYREKVSKVVPPTFMEMGREIERIIEPYAQMIRDGYQPSESFLLARECSRTLMRQGRSRQ